MAKPTILWFRQDLRLADNPALLAALERAAPILPLYVLDETAPNGWRCGGAARWWLHGSLHVLGEALMKRGVPLLLRRGRAEEVLTHLVEETGAEALFWNRCYEPWAIERDKAIKTRFAKEGLAVRSFNSALLAEPWEVQTKDGGSYRVFTPFRRTLFNRLEGHSPPGSIIAPCAPERLPSLQQQPGSERLEDWALRPLKPDWAGGLRACWRPGEAGAQQRLARFIDEGLESYEACRDRPDREGTSRLSPHLHWGEIGPRQVWAALGHASGKSAQTFRSELAWREFSYHLLFHNPQLPERNLRKEFDAFPWNRNERKLKAWQKGQTGYPIVDAGMRELWATGWMHNRVRMIAASFLVKHLLQPWQAGACWFWDTLVDADLANNSASWQWVAGCGADAAPYFRIFNPVLQGEKFDPMGDYVRQWVPEVRELPSLVIHKPWMLDSPPKAYPGPIVDLAVGRKRALEAYETIKT